MAISPAHARELARLWDGTIQWDCPMARHSTFKVGGPAEALLKAESRAGLTRMIRWLNQEGIRWQVLGRGSNILVPDAGLSGVVFLLGGELAAMEIQEKGTTGALIEVGAGASLAKLVQYATAQGLSGLEFAAGIPGSVGGAVVMNAGAWGRDFGPLVRTLYTVDRDGTEKSWSRAELHFSYRQWEQRRDQVVLSCELELVPEPAEEIRTRCLEYLDQRRAKQPAHLPSAGSFFKNPHGDAAGRLIEAAGLKGVAVGGAMVSQEHANFIVNTGTATARDILALMEKIQATVRNRFGISLEPEVQLLGLENGGM